jgi:amphi-Trp domain-containing protein
VCKGSADGRRPAPVEDDHRTEDVVSDELMEVTEELTLSREAAAARLRQLADQLSRNNQVEFVREGIRYSVKVPNEVKLKIEIEVGEESEIEFEISW